MLQEFQGIQTELNACLTCLDDGVEEIDYIARPESSRSMTEAELSATESSVDTEEQRTKHQGSKSDDTDEIARMYKVFESFIAQDIDPSFLSFDDDFVTQEEINKSKREKKQSKQILQELKGALVDKETKWEVREGRTVARQENVNDEDEIHRSKLDSSEVVDDPSTETNGFLSVPKSLLITNILGKV